TGQKVTPSLMFTGEKENAEDAIGFYNSVFKASDIEGVLKFEKGEEGPAGFVKHAQSHLEGQTFMAMAGGANHNFAINDAISLRVKCKNQEELDYYWEKLSAIPETEQYGWLKDKFGVSWQIVPENIVELTKPKKAMEAMLKMKKLDIEKLQNAS